MDTINKKFFLYTRKSTDDGTRQVRSLGDQMAEARELAKREGLTIVDTLVEKQTAKMPGRPIFNEMLERIEKGEANGIIAWHPDRLARNSLDGGRIIWLVDIGKIIDLKFPSYRFDLTPQGKLSLAIEFGISKYYVDKLSHDINRGIKQKLLCGLFPNQAPIGYLNDKTTKIIFPDPEKAPLIRKCFEMYATGNYTLRQVNTTMSELGLCGRRYGKMSTANYQYILRNPVYYGLIRFHGEYYEAKHEPLISKALYDEVQAVMTSRSKPKSNRLKPYLYRGLFRCGECGRLITTERQKDNNYLRCTKWEVACSQRYVRESAIAGQVTAALDRVALPPEWADWMLAEAKAEQASKAEAVAMQVQAIKAKIRATDEHLDRLMTAYVEGVLSLAEYKEGKNKLVAEKRSYEEEKAAVEQNLKTAFEPLTQFILAAKTAGKVAKTGTEEQRRDFFRKVASNPNVFNRELRFEPRGAWQLVVDQGSFAQSNIASPSGDAIFAGENHHDDKKRRR